MSGGEYENYTETSKHYDTGRKPVGLEVFVGSIALLMKGDLNKACLVDIGCGTGNYACALSPYVGQITGVEYNPGMLEQAKAKAANLKNVKLVQGDATNIPLPDGYCDVVYCTQVIHHLMIEDGVFTGFNKFVKESYRILKEHGILIINTDSPEQTEKCWFGAGLAPMAGKTMSIRKPPTATVISEMEATGYKIQSINLHSYPNIQAPAIFKDNDGPLNAEWRALDSAWSLCSQEELEKVKKIWREKQEKGTTSEFFEERNRLIKQIGETTTVVGYKGLVN